MLFVVYFDQQTHGRNWSKTLENYEKSISLWTSGMSAWMTGTYHTYHTYHTFPDLVSLPPLKWSLISLFHVI